MFHQHQCRQIVHQIVKTHGGEGNGADEAEKDTHGCQEPLVQHDACKKERRNDGVFLFGQLIRSCLPDFFNIHIDSFIKINKNLIYFLMIFQECVEEICCGNAFFQFHSFDEAICCQ